MTDQDLNKSQSPPSTSTSAAMETKLASESKTRIADFADLMSRTKTRRERSLESNSSTSARGLPSPSLSASERTTFVYPAKSLLPKHLLPASPSAEEDVERPPFSQRPSGTLSRRTTDTSTTTMSMMESTTESDNASTKARSIRRGSFHQEDYGNLPALLKSTGLRTLPSTPAVDRDVPTSSKSAQPINSVNQSSPSNSPTRSNKAPPSLDQTMAPAAFASSNSATATLTQLVHETQHQSLSLPVPSENILESRKDIMSPEGSNNSQTQSDYFAPPENDQNPPSEDLQPSQEVTGSMVDDRESRQGLVMAGIVHLGPRQSSSAASVTSRGRSVKSRRSLSPGEGSPSESSQRVDSPDYQPSQADSTMDEPLIVTQRFQYATDSDGHHVITGREGVLTRCEDEPIRTPGAIQGFGVLIALEEEMESGNFVVRQVSENSTQILGLSPKYLFSLECFTDCLPDSDQDIFFDNIQFLNVPDAMDDNDDKGEDTTHVFVLSGYGEPYSADSDDVETGPEERRLWRCWCAAHRPRSVTSSTGDGPSLSSDVSNMIILEFELERDPSNPLYPTPSQAGTTSGMQTPDSAGGSQGTGGSHATGDSRPSTNSTFSGNTLWSGRDSERNGSTHTRDSLTAVSNSVVTTGEGPQTPEESNAVGLVGEDNWQPTAEHIFESTTNRAKPLPALERLRQMNRGLSDSRASTPATRGSGSRRRQANRRPAPPPGVGMMDIFAVISQINEQLGQAPDLDSFLRIVVGVIKDLTQFHRVLVYQFDEQWNGQVVAELVDWHRTHDLYQGLHFPASDIPAQARELYTINKVRLLYDRDLPTARIVCRTKEDLVPPLNMTHCYLRAMSPIHIKYLANMGVRASMSVSIMAFGGLWGLIACHSYGNRGMRVSFPVRQMLRLLSQSISRNIERLSYAQRLQTRKLINTVTSESHPGGYIVSNADDLLGLFDADYGMLVIGEGAKILGPPTHGQEILIVAEYLRVKQFSTLQVSQAVTTDFPDLKLTSGLEIIAGLLYVPLSSGGKDFIAFLRKGQPREVHWAGKPFKPGSETQPSLEPRVSFKSWSQTVAGRSRAWTDEQMETAGVLALVYGKFIEVWRQKETALQSTKLTNLLLSNASHEVRTPLNHIIGYLELALNGPLDGETRDNLQRSHNASKSLLFTINDLLDLTRLESGNELAFNEPFNLKQSIADAAALYIHEASRRRLQFNLDLDSCPERVVGDSKKIQTVVANLTGNALKYTDEGSITVEARAFDEPHGLRDADGIAVEIVVADTGCGISSSKLESIFREFEQVESMGQAPEANEGVGLGLAVVAHIVEQLGGQLRVDSKVGEGSRFSFLIPFALSQGEETSRSPSLSLYNRSRTSSTRNSAKTGSTQKGSAKTGSASSEIDMFVEAISSSHLGAGDLPVQASPGTATNVHRVGGSTQRLGITPGLHREGKGYFEVEGSNTPIRGVRIDETDMDHAVNQGHIRTPLESATLHQIASPVAGPSSAAPVKRLKVSLQAKTKLRVLIVEDDDVNRMLLAKRMGIQGHEVVNTTNGQECVNKVEVDRDFDIVLMDVQMPILNGFQATERVRELEAAGPLPDQQHRLSHQLNGRIPIFAVSASLKEDMKERMCQYGLDGWILKPLDFKRLTKLMEGITDTEQRAKDLYSHESNWERGGWLTEPAEKQKDFAA